MNLAVKRGYDAGLTYTVTMSGDVSKAELIRATRMLDATVLAIQDKAPLFDGPAPDNTNQSDIKNYQ